MSTLSPKLRELSAKIVFYGPGLGGKTTTLQAIHRALKPELRGQLISLATGVDRTLYFDFLPIKTRVRDFNVRVQLYTVPGQVHYNSTRKLVLNGADGVVFVADSQRQRFLANAESLSNLEENLREQGCALADMPLVIQYNKRDAPDAVTVEELHGELGRFGAPTFETVAIRGKGVFGALREVIKLTLQNLSRQGSLAARAEEPTTPPARQPLPAVEVPLEHAAPDRAPALASKPVPTAGSLDEIAHLIDNLPSQPSIRLSPSRSSYDRIAGAIEESLPDEPSGLIQGARPIEPATELPERSLGALVQLRVLRSAIAEVEGAIDRNDPASACQRAVEAYSSFAVDFADRLGGGEPAAAVAVTSALLGVPGVRLLRFGELRERAASGEVSSQDALFALLFLADVGLRVEELRGRAHAGE